jgi:hypothetical protein
MKKVRFNLYMDQELSDRLEMNSKRFDLPKSALVTMSVRAGLDTIIRAMAPEDALTTERWAEIIAAAMQKVGEVEKSKETGNQTD